VVRLLGDQRQRQQLQIALREHAADAEPIAATAFGARSPAGTSTAEAAETTACPKSSAAAVFRMSQSTHISISLN
jgi:hypothetical protein